MSHEKQPVHPGTILLEQVMKPLGISRNQLARDIDVPVGRISDITNGKRGITADTALRLAHYFGTDAELWMRLQADYDLHVARITCWPAIEPRVRIIRAPGSDGAAPPNLRADGPVGAKASPDTPVARLHSSVVGISNAPQTGPAQSVRSNGAEADKSAGPVPPAPDPGLDAAEPYPLTNPLDDDDVVEDRIGDLVIPPLPRK